MIAGGCKSKKSSLDAVQDAAVTISKKDFGDIGDLLKVPARDVSTADAETALKAVGLWDESNKISWDSRSGDKGTYKFKNVSITPPKGETVKIKTLTLAGLHMANETPLADLITLSDLSITDDDASLTVENMGLTGVVMADNLGSLDDLTDLDSKSVVISGAKMRGEDGQTKVDFDIDNLGWGLDPKDNYLRAAVKNISFNATGRDAMSLKLTSANMRGLAPAVDSSSATLSNLSDPDGFLKLLGENQQLGDAEITGFEVDGDFFSIRLPKFTQTAKEKGKVTHVDFDMPALTVSIQEEDAPASAKQHVEIIQSLGFDEMKFSSKGQTEINVAADLMKMKAISFDLQDGFDLNYSGEIEGFGAVQALGANAPVADIQAAQSEIKIHDFSLSLEDKSIVERGFNLAGKMTGQTPKNLRRQANGILALGSLAALTQDDGAIYSEFTKALGVFIQDGGTFNISLKPETPLSVSDFESLSQGKKPDLKRLGFSASTTQ